MRFLSGKRSFYEASWEGNTVRLTGHTCCDYRQYGCPYLGTCQAKNPPSTTVILQKSVSYKDVYRYFFGPDAIADKDKVEDEISIKSFRIGRIGKTAYIFDRDVHAFVRADLYTSEVSEGFRIKTAKAYANPEYVPNYLKSGDGKKIERVRVIRNFDGYNFVAVPEGVAELAYHSPIFVKEYYTFSRINGLTDLYKIGDDIYAPFQTWRGYESVMTIMEVAKESLVPKRRVAKTYQAPAWIIEASRGMLQAGDIRYGVEILEAPSSNRGFEEGQRIKAKVGPVAILDWGSVIVSPKAITLRIKKRRDIVWDTKLERYLRETSVENLFIFPVSFREYGIYEIER